VLQVSVVDPRMTAPGADVPGADVPGAHVVVLVGGAPLPDEMRTMAHAALASADAVIAADGGYAHAVILAAPVDHLVGDLDSIEPAHLAHAQASGVHIHRHPTDKDATDLELALELTRTLTTPATSDRTRVTVIGGHGGRSDHLLGNVLLLAGEQHADLRIHALWGGALVDIVRDTLEFDTPIGTLLSLLAVHGPARGVRTTGLAYPLDAEDLPAGSSRGLSNRTTSPRVRIEVQHGALAVIRPEPTQASPTPDAHDAP